MEKLVSVGRAKKHLKLKILVSKFVPWDLEATRTWDLEATRDGTSRQPAWTSRQAAMIRAGSLEVRAGWLKVPSQVVSKVSGFGDEKTPFFLKSNATIDY